MTITTNPSRDEYISSAGQTVFNYTFKIYANNELDVYVTPAGQQANDATDLTTDYVVDPVTIGDKNGGFITFNTPLNSGDAVTIVSGMDYDRTVDYQVNGDFIPSTVNTDNDRQVSQIKQVLELARKAVVFGQAQQSTSGLTSEAPEAGKYIRWKNDLSGFENTDLTDVGSLVPVSSIDVVYPTVALMKADSLNILVPGVMVSTQGYYSAGDGGGATYLVAGAQAVDGFGSHTLNNSNTAIIQPGCCVDVKTFGATGDGATNDSPAVQACIDYASPLKRETFFPGVTNSYQCPDGLVGADNMTLMGEGEGSLVDLVTGSITNTDKTNISITKMHLRNDGTDEVVTNIGCSNVYEGYNLVTQPGGSNGNVAVFSHKDSGTQGGENYTVEHNEIYGSTTSQIFFQAAAGREMSNIKISNNRIFGDNMPTLNEAQSIKLDLHCNNYEIAENLINGEQTPGGNVVIVMGISVEEDVINGIVRDNTILFCGGGIRIFDGQGGLRVDNLQCYSNTIRDLFNYGTGIGGAIAISVSGDAGDPHIGLDIHDNFIDGCSDGIQFSEGSAVDVDVNSNTVLNATGSSYVLRGNTVRFSNNTSRGAGARGVNIDGCENLIGSDNKFYDSTSQSVRIFASTGVKLQNTYAEASISKTEEVSISGGGGYHELIGGAISTAADTGIAVFSSSDGIGTRLDLFDIQGAVNKPITYFTSDAARPPMQITGGVGTVTTLDHRPIPEGAAPDDLDTINGMLPNFTYYFTGSGTQTVTFKDGTGNLSLAGDFVMDNFADRIALRLDGAGTTIYEVSRSNNA